MESVSANLQKGGRQSLPVENEGVSGVEDTEEANIVDDLLRNVQVQVLCGGRRTSQDGT